MYLPDHIKAMFVTAGGGSGASGGLSSAHALDDIAAANPVSVSTVCVLYSYVYNVHGYMAASYIIVHWLLSCFAHIGYMMLEELYSHRHRTGQAAH